MTPNTFHEDLTTRNERLNKQSFVMDIIAGVILGGLLAVMVLIFVGII